MNTGNELLDTAKRNCSQENINHAIENCRECFVEKIKSASQNDERKFNQCQIKMKFSTVCILRITYEKTANQWNFLLPIVHVYRWWVRFVTIFRTVGQILSWTKFAALLATSIFARIVARFFVGIFNAISFFGKPFFCTLSITVNFNEMMKFTKNQRINWKSKKNIFSKTKKMC